MYKLVDCVLSNCHMILLKNESIMTDLQITMLEIKGIFLEAINPKHMQIMYRVSIIA